MVGRLLLALALVILQTLLTPATAAAADADQRDIRDIHGPVQLHFLPPFAITGVMTLLLAGLLYLHRARRQCISIMPGAVRDKADTTNFLERLSEDFRQGRCGGDEAIVRLDALMRNEIEIRVGLPARQLTSQELICRLDQLMLQDDATRALMGQLLALSDRAKFSHYRPTDADAEAALDIVRIVFDHIPMRRPA